MPLQGLKVALCMLFLYLKRLRLEARVDRIFLEFKLGLGLGLGLRLGCRLIFASLKRRQSRRSLEPETEPDSGFRPVTLHSVAACAVDMRSSIPHPGGSLDSFKVDSEE